MSGGGAVVGHEWLVGRVAMPMNESLAVNRGSPLILSVHRKMDSTNRVNPHGCVSSLCRLWFVCI